MRYQLYTFLASLAIAGAAASGPVYRLAKTIPWSPKAPKSVDQSVIYNGTYYLSDRSNGGVHVINLSTDTQKTIVKGFTSVIVNNSISSTSSGPNGLIVIPDRNELYAGDGKGIVRVIDLLTDTIVANISTGSTKRADEMAYDPSTSTVVVTNPDEDTPYVSLINTKTQKVLGKVLFHNASGLEQPAYNPADGLFYISVVSTGANPGGAIAVLDLSNPHNYTTSKTLPLSECVPAGIAFGVVKNQLFVSCSETQISTFKIETSYIMDVTTGAIVTKVPGVSGVDQVTHSAKTGYFYASAYQDETSSGSLAPALYIIAANGTVLQSIKTDNVTAHSVAVEPVTAAMVVPVQKKGVLVYDLV